MRKFEPLLIALLFIVITAFKADNLPTQFNTLLNRAQLVFTPPEGMVEVPVTKNRQMNYEYALKLADKNFEVRYTIRPLDSALMKYADWEKNKKEGSVMISPNKMYNTAIMAIMMNICGGGRMPKVGPYNAEAVKYEFNADWGATAVGIPSGDFSTGYKYCVVTALHKDNVADAYVFFLTDDQANLTTEIPKAFHTLKFK